MDEITRILVFAVIFTLSAAALLMLSFSISHQRKLHHKKQLLEQEYKTREEALLQMSRDLHDDVGSSLSGINMLAQLAMAQAQSNKSPHELLQKISTYTNEVIDKVSDMVWLMKPEDESLQLLIAKLKSYGAACGASKGIALHFDCPLQSHLPLTIQQRKTIYLISKEAINNAIKYAGCRNIYYTFSLKGNGVAVQIKDDGRGFSITDFVEGNGLRNMKARAEEMGAMLKIASVPGEGTLIVLEFTQSGDNEYQVA